MPFFKLQVKCHCGFMDHEMDCAKLNSRADDVGKIIDPLFDKREIPYSCGEVCGKPLKYNSNNNHNSSTSEGVCPHKCVELCHPGPCPPCVASILQ